MKVTYWVVRMEINTGKVLRSVAKLSSVIKHIILHQPLKKRHSLTRIIRLYRSWETRVIFNPRWDKQNLS